MQYVETCLKVRKRLERNGRIFLRGFVVSEDKAHGF
jgi:hypothetical protein